MKSPFETAQPLPSVARTFQEQQQKRITKSRLSVPATSIGTTVTTLATAGAREYLQVDFLAAYNPNGGSVNAVVNFVKSGDSAGATTNRIYIAAVGTTATDRISEVEGYVLGPGDSLQVASGGGGGDMIWFATLTRINQGE